MGRVLSMLALAAVSGICGSVAAQPESSSSPAPPAVLISHSSAQEPLVFPNAAVAADHTLASQAGLEVLRAGGNAVDAAVATSFALSVVRPYSCGIGGGGFMVVFLKHHPRLAELTSGKGDPLTTCINYRETSIAAMGPEFFEKDPDPDAPTRGGKSVAIPGHVAGMLHALEKYGTLSREQVLAPAIRLAEKGYAADAHYVASSQEIIEWINAAPGRAERFPDLWNRLLMKGQVKVGDHIDQSGQAAVLRAIAAEGARAFYRGPVADAIVKAVRDDQGLMTLDDLRGYTVEERAPLVTTFRGDTVLSMPPPSSGGIVLAQVLGIIEAREAEFTRIVKTHGHNSPEYVHFVVEASKHAFADRARWMGDPNFVDVPVRSLLSRSYIADRAAAIDMTKVLAPEEYGTADQPTDDHGTSHLCVVDAWGNAVGCSETINLVFGSLVSVEGYGFILNDTVDDFLTRDGQPNAFGLSHATANRPEPGKRPLSSMTPTIVLSDPPDLSVPAIARTPRKPGELSPRAKPTFIGGGSGGPRIISGTIQATLNSLVFGMGSTEALAKPRFHHQWKPNVLQLEKELRGTELEAAMKTRFGHETGPRDPVAAVQIIRAVEGGWSPASDPRKGGAPAGY